MCVLLLCLTSEWPLSVQHAVDTMDFTWCRATHRALYLMHIHLINDAVYQEGSMRLINIMRLIVRCTNNQSLQYHKTNVYDLQLDKITFYSLHKVFLLCWEFQIRNDHPQSRHILHLGLRQLPKSPKPSSCKINKFKYIYKCTTIT